MRIDDEIASIATGRDFDLFSPDIAARREEIAGCVEGRRFLFIGGAGSIGSATLRALLDFVPAAVHVVDQNENSLAELVRDLRSSPRGLNVPDFRCLPLDFGSPIMHRFLLEQPPYDAILNFAAIKHVRSEKDTCSLLQMWDTNVLKNARLLRWLNGPLAPARFFSVSTDKAANPVNLMGASKRLMEDVIFASLWTKPPGPRVTSARFANVAFSEGSLLQSFQKRLEKRQPLAVPKGTRRYFISLREAGQICLLALVCAPPGHLLIPRLDPESDLRELEAIAVAFLRQHGWEPKVYENELSARTNVENDTGAGKYPLLLTPLDTCGEKAFEEFVGEGESAVEVRLPNLVGIEARPGPSGVLERFLKRIESIIEDNASPAGKEWLKREMRSLMPTFRHKDTPNSLDDRM
ncbi:MAG: polysaccharide biosynthesis protein [Acidobacteria bacterium]|nr:polysaccharide biosynthesis protein [Acidobacteriota bacterium]